MAARNKDSLACTLNWPITYFLYGSIQSEAISRYAVFRSNWPATAAGIADGDWVVLETAMARVWLKAKCNDELHPRVVATQYGWWQGCRELGRQGYDPFRPDGANVNLLICNAALDPISASVQHRAQMCRVRKEG